MTRDGGTGPGALVTVDDVDELAAVVDALRREPGVTDVLLGGRGTVWVDRGDGVRSSRWRAGSDECVRSLAIRLVTAAGRRLDDAMPWADARLVDGTRIHAVLSPLAAGGTSLSIRVPPRRTFTLDELVAAGSLPATAVDLLRSLVRAKAAFLVTGGTGTGKTTVLSALLSLADPAERLVLVEDAAELRPEHPHVVRLESRPANPEGAGGVGLDVLVRQALRMRPDRLVVGEVRGAEVLDLLAALNTGHSGGCATIHANRGSHLPARIESLCVRSGVPRAAAHSLLSVAVDAVVHLVRDGARRVAGVGVVDSDPDGCVRVVPAYAFQAGTVQRGAAATRLDDLLARAS